MSNMVEAMSYLLSEMPESIGKVMMTRPNDNMTSGSIPVDILDTPKEYVFYVDVPGLSKSDIQVTVEDEKTLVIKTGGGGKRKREEEEEGKEEGCCKYLRVERGGKPQKLMRKFKLPDNADVSKVRAKCENGVLTVVVDKHTPPPHKSKTLQVQVS